MLLEQLFENFLLFFILLLQLVILISQFLIPNF